MLKNLDPLLSPQLLYMLAEMGHGDSLAIVDRNYPAASSCDRVVRLEGATTREATKAVLSVLPVDTFDEPAVMKIVPTGQRDFTCQVHEEFQAILDESEARPVPVLSLERADFYAASRGCCGIVQTGEPTGFSCFIIVKGII